MPNNRKEEKYISLLEAARIYGCTQKHMALMAREKKLRAIKLGRNWLTTIDWLKEYNEAIEENNKKRQIKKAPVKKVIFTPQVKSVFRKAITASLISLVVFAFISTAYIAVKEGSLSLALFEQIIDRLNNLDFQNSNFASVRVFNFVRPLYEKHLASVFDNLKPIYQPVYSKVIKPITIDISNTVRTVIRGYNKTKQDVFAFIDKLFTKSGNFVVNFISNTSRGIVKGPSSFGKFVVNVFQDLPRSLKKFFILEPLFVGFPTPDISEQSFITIKDLYKKLSKLRDELGGVGELVELIEGREIIIPEPGDIIQYITVVKKIEGIDQETLDELKISILVEVDAKISAIEITDFESMTFHHDSLWANIGSFSTALGVGGFFSAVGPVTLGDGSEKVVINATNWDVDDSGNITTGGNISLASLTASGDITASGNITGSGTLVISGQATFTGAPSGTTVSEGSVYINPSTASSSYALFGIAVNGTEKLRLDAEGDLIIAGSLTAASTSFDAIDATTLSLDKIPTIISDPVLLMQPTNVSGSWATGSATFLGINASSSFDGNFADFRINNTSKFFIDEAGNLGTAGVGQFGNISTLSYSRFGIATTSYSLIDSDDLLISGMLEVDDAAYFDSTVSISGNFDLSGIFTADTSASHSFAGDLSINNDLTVTGNVSILDTLTVSGKTFLQSTASVSSNFEVDTDTFYVDADNNKVGIGNTSPNAKFDVAGSGIFDNELIVGSALQVGGTTSVSYSRFGIGTTLHDLSETQDVMISGKLEVASDSWFDSNASVSGKFEVLGNTTLGDADTDLLIVNAYIASDLIPNINDYYVGTTDNRWRYGYFDSVNINTLYAEYTEISGTKSETFTINSDNETEDTEDAWLTFERGPTFTNASLKWDYANDRFNLNFPLEIQDNDVNTELFAITSSSVGDLFVVKNDGKVGIGTTGPSALLSVGSTSQFQVNSSGAIAAVVGITNTGAITSTGGIINLNASSNYAVNIATGTSTGAVTIGGNSNTVYINSSDWDMSTTGVMTGISGITTDGGYTQSGSSANTFTGTTTFSGAIDSDGDVSITDTNIAFDGASTTFTTTGAFTLTPGGAVILGDDGDTMYINTSDWDISTTGAMTGISGISNDGSYTQSGSSANTFTGTSTFSNATYSALFTGGNVGIGTISPNAELDVGGGIVSHIDGTDDILVADDLEVDGQAWFDSNASVSGKFEVLGNITLGDADTDLLVVNADIASNLIPNDNTRYVGDTNSRWAYGYFDELNVTSMSAEGTYISGTRAETFTINSDNETEDTEDAWLTFERGPTFTNASLKWDYANDRFNLNFPLEIQDNDVNTELFAITSSSVGDLFVVKNDGKVGIGNTAPALSLEVGDITLGVDAANGIGVQGDLEVEDFALLGALRVGSTGTDPGAGNAYLEGNLTITGNNLYDSGADSFWETSGYATNKTVSGISSAGTISYADISLPSTQLTDGGTIGFEWVDAEVSDTLTASIFKGSGTTTDAVDLATAEVAGTLTVNKGGTGATTFTANGVLYGNTQSAIQALAVNATATNKFLTQVSSGAPAWNTIAAGDLPGSFSGFANPTATIGLTVINGSATTAMRSDAAPPLSQAITPTWTGTHTFSNATYSALFTGGNVGIGTTTPGSKLTVQDATAGDGGWVKGILIKNTGDPVGESALAFNNISTGSNYWISGLNQSDIYKLIYGTAFTDTGAKLTLDTAGNLTISGTGSFTGALSAPTLDTGQGAYELYSTLKDLVAGTGLTGGGDNTLYGLDGDVTLNVVGGTCITANADNVAVTGNCIDDAQVVDNGLDATSLAAGSVTVAGGELDAGYAGAGLAGGGASALAVGGGTCITVNADNVAVTGNCIGNTQLEFDTGQALTTGSSPTFVRLTLSQATGTSPFAITSTTVNTNLNADLLDGLHSTNFLQTESLFYYNTDVGAIENASPQYWILCRNAASNDVNGRLRIDRTSGNSQAASLDIVVTSNTTAVLGGSLTTNQYTQTSETYELVTLTLTADANSYVAIKYTGNTYPKTVSRFTGHVRNSGSNTFLAVAAAGVSSVVSLPTTNSKYTFTGNVGIGTTTPGAKLDVRASTANVMHIYDSTSALVLELDEGSSPIYWGQGLSSQFIQGTFYHTITSSKNDHVYLEKDGSGNYYTSGNYISVIRDTNGISQFDTLRTIAIIPSSTKIKAQVQVSDDNFATIKDSIDFDLTGDLQTFDIGSLTNARYVRVKFDFQTNDASVSPHLVSFEVWYYVIEPVPQLTQEVGTLTHPSATYDFLIVNGNLGIGTTAPSAILHTSKSGSGDQEAARFSAPSGDPYITVGNGVTSTTGGYLIWRDASDYLGMGIHGADPVLSIKSGNLGIGTTSPTGLLDVGGGSLVVSSIGNVGIGGTASISEDLYVGNKLCLGETCINEEDLKSFLGLKIASSSGTIEDNITITYSTNPIEFLGDLINGLKELGVSIKDGVIEAVKLVVDEVKTKILRANTISITVEPDQDNVVGSATIPCDSMEYQVENSLVEENSKIFVSFTSNTAGRTWYVSEKTPGVGFTIRLSEVTTKPLDFDYWIVLVEGSETDIIVPEPQPEVASESEPIVPETLPETASQSEPIIEESVGETASNSESLEETVVEEEPVVEPAENPEDIQAGPPACETCGGEPVVEEPIIEEPSPEPAPEPEPPTEETTI